MHSTTIKSMLTAFACLAMAACQTTDTPTTPIDDTGKNGKGPQPLSNCFDVFADISSCAIGGANIEFNADGSLFVTGFDPSSGISSSFSDATEWSQYAGDVTQAGQYVRYSAISHGDAVSTLTIAGNEEGDGSYEIAPTFTGSPDGYSFTANFYLNGALVASLPGQGPGNVFKQVPTGPGCNVWRKFKNNQTGQCEWILVWTVPCPTPVWELEEVGPVVADMVVFTEEIEDGGYPYRNFQEITVDGTLDSYRIVSESVTAD